MNRTAITQPIGLTTSILTTAILGMVMAFLPLEASVWVAAGHLVIWTIFIFRCVGLDFLWHPGPTSWFIVTVVSGFASWNVFYITGELFYKNTTIFYSVCSLPLLGIEADRGCFYLTAIAWCIFRLGADRIIRRLTLNDHDMHLNISESARNTAFFFGLVGAAASLPRFQLAGALAQPMLLLSYWFRASLAIGLLSASKETVFSRRFAFVFAQILIIGMLGFLSSGAKGALFLNIFFAIWLIGCENRELRLKSFLGGALVFAIFLFLLPSFQQAKDAFSMTRSTDKATTALMKGLEEQASGRFRFGNDKGFGQMGNLWEYLGIRLCVATMTQKYLQTYGDNPHETGTLGIVMENVLPRILAPNKRSSNFLYNEIARKTGIGGYDDFETSRKPSFIEDCLINWGRSGFLIGGIVFGVYLLTIESLIAYFSKNRETLIVLRYTTLTLGQLPYFAVIVGAVPYAIIFSLITVGFFLNRTQLNSR